MYFTYIIQNNKTKRRYIGSTENLERRLDQHNSGKTKSTKYGVGLWEIIYKEEYLTRNEAIKRELMIKSYKGGNGLRKLLSITRD